MLAGGTKAYCQCGLRCGWDQCPSVGDWRKRRSCPASRSGSARVHDCGHQPICSVHSDVAEHHAVGGLHVEFCSKGTSKPQPQTNTTLEQGVHVALRGITGEASPMSKANGRTPSQRTKQKLEAAVQELAVWFTGTAGSVPSCQPRSPCCRSRRWAFPQFQFVVTQPNENTKTPDQLFSIIFH